MNKSFKEMKPGLYKVAIVEPSFDFLLDDYEEHFDRLHVKCDLDLEHLFKLTELETIVKLDANLEDVISIDNNKPLSVVVLNRTVLTDCDKKHYPQTKQSFYIRKGQLYNKFNNYCVLFLHDEHKKKYNGKEDIVGQSSGFINAESFKLDSVEFKSSKNLFELDDGVFKDILSEYAEGRETREAQWRGLLANDADRRAKFIELQQIEEIRQKMPESLKANITRKDKAKVKVYEHYFVKKNQQ